MAFVVVVANNKGGVGKSQFVVQLTAALARRGLKVLVGDLDPQANATRRLGVGWSPDEPVPTMSEVIRADTRGAGQGAVLACAWTTPEAELIDVLPARFDLINREAEAGVVGAHRRLVKALDGWAESYDVLILDTPPNLGHLPQLGFAAADTVLIVAEPEYDAVEAAVRVRDFIDEHAADLTNPNLTVGGVIVTMRRATSEHNFQLEGLKDLFGDLVWDLRTTHVQEDGTEVEVTPSHIPAWSRFAEADSAAASLAAWTDARGRETTALFDVVAQQFTDRFLTHV